MAPVSDKERHYLKKWESNRKRRWRYITTNGILWSLPVAIISYCWRIDFTISALNMSDAAVYLAVFLPGGIFYQYWMFRGQERRYQEVRRQLD
ncbi:MAG TPA: hypothetical protein VD816_11530 [Ohtaekwangia sp.]|nr:hypothetical protein [Ohtaekwangia sp.]